MVCPVHGNTIPRRYEVSKGFRNIFLHFVGNVLWYSQLRGRKAERAKGRLAMELTPEIREAIRRAVDDAGGAASDLARAWNERMAALATEAEGLAARRSALLAVGGQL